MFKGYRSAIFAGAVLVCALITGCGGSSSSSNTPLSASGTTLAGGTVGTPYTAPLTASGGTVPYTWSVVSGGALPTGLTLISAGTVAGTPMVAGTFGPYVFSVTDKKGATATSSGMSITIAPQGELAVTTDLLPDPMVGSPYSFKLAATGGTPPYSWTITSGGDLPPGLLPLTNTGTVAGLPTVAGIYGPYVFTVSDASHTTAVSAPLTLTVDAALAGCLSEGNEAALNAATPYGFLLKGTDGSGAPIDIAGSFTPNGTGGITAASLDYNGFSNGPEQEIVDVANSSYSFSTSSQGCLYLAFTAQAASRLGVSAAKTTTANIAGDSRTTQFANRKTASRAGKSLISAIATAPGNAKFRYYLGQFSASVYHSGRIIEADNLDGTGTNAAGFVYAQTTSNFAVSSLQPNYAFGVDGWLTPDGVSLVRTAIAGTFTNTDGVLSAGFADSNEGGVASGELTGGSGQINATIDSTTGRGTGTYTTSGPGGLTFDFVIYILNGSDFILLSTDSPASTPLLAGRAMASDASYSANALNGFYLSAWQGFDAAAPGGGNRVEIGTLNLTNTGAIPTANFYSNDSGTPGQSQFPGSSYTVDGASGRVAFAGFGSTPPVLYLATANSDDNIAGFTVGTDARASSGVLVNQTADTPAYTLASLAGSYGVGTDDDIDGRNGAYLATLAFNGAGDYAISSPVTTGIVQVVPSLKTYTVNADGSGLLDDSNFTFVTNGAQIYAIPNNADPLLFVFQQGTRPH